MSRHGSKRARKSSAAAPGGGAPSIGPLDLIEKFVAPAEEIERLKAEKQELLDAAIAHFKTSGMPVKFYAEPFEAANPAEGDVLKLRVPLTVAGLEAAMTDAGCEDGSSSTLFCFLIGFIQRRKIEGEQLACAMELTITGLDESSVDLGVSIGFTGVDADEEGNIRSIQQQLNVTLDDYTLEAAFTYA